MNNNLAKFRYEDSYGKNEVTFNFENNLYKFILRGINFEVHSLINFSIPESQMDRAKKVFEIMDDQVVNYTITAIIRLQFKINGNIMDKNAKVKFKVLKDDYLVCLKNIDIDQVNYNIKETYSFEHMLIELQLLITPRTQLQACISCKNSCFFPAGNDGYLICCFKEKKEKFLKIKGKDNELFELFWEGGNSYYPVSYVCEEYDRITKDNWNYSEWSDYIK